MGILAKRLICSFIIRFLSLDKWSAVQIPSPAYIAAWFSSSKRNSS
jgi:hypothetical protein